MISTAPKRSIHSRLLGYMSAVCLVTITIIGSTVFWKARVALEDSVQASLQVAVTLKEDAIQRWITTQKADVAWLAGLPSLSEHAAVVLSDRIASSAAESRIRQLMDLSLVGKSHWRELSLLSPRGEVVISSRAASEGRYRSREAFFIEGRRTPFVQKVYPSPVDYRPTITLSAPLKTETGELTGVVAAHIDLAAIEVTINEHDGLGDGAASYLVDGFGALVTGTWSDVADGARRADSEAVNNAIAGRRGVGSYTNHRLVEVLGAYRWIESLDAALIVETPRQTALRPAGQLALEIGFIGLLTSIALITVIHLVSKQITRPVSELIGVAAEVARGNLDARAKRLSNDEVGSLVDTFNTMTERLKAHYDRLSESVVELEYLSGTDKLTGLANRRKLEARLNTDWQQVRAQGGVFSALFIDIDYFKNYNDAYGHHTGDLCLQKVAQCLCEHFVHPDHLAARYGGEEFVVLMPAVGADDARRLALGFCSAVEELDVPHRDSSICDHLTVSIGVASTTPAEGDPAALLRAADKALYAAKARGRNRVAFEAVTA